MKTIEEIEQFAAKNYVPIARKPLIQYMIKTIQEHQYTRMLEIGTGIAYTCICLAKHTPIHITSIEYSLDRYQLCVENIHDFDFDSRIQLIFGDATQIEIQDSFDLIFIDAAKLKNQLFFDKFSPLLSYQGMIIIDNMDLKDFKARVSKEKYEKYATCNQRLKEYLESREDFSVEYLNIGDGILKIIRK